MVTLHTQPTPPRWHSSCRRQKVFTSSKPNMATTTPPTPKLVYYTSMCILHLGLLTEVCDLVDSLNLCVLKNKDMTLNTCSYHRNQWWPVNKRYSRSWIHATCLKFVDGKDIRLCTIRATLSVYVRKLVTNRQLDGFKFGAWKAAMTAGLNQYLLWASKCPTLWLSFIRNIRIWFRQILG